MSLNKFVPMFMIFVTFTDGNHGDYHPSSSAAFDEGKLSSISRFYPIGTLLKFWLILCSKNYNDGINVYDPMINCCFIS